MKPFLSIIVPVYKIEETYLRNCLDSLANQGREDYQVILVDDGSPDHCGEICEEYASGNPLFKVIHQENQGVSVARNNGIELVDTQWMTFVDPDDWIESDFVTTLYELKEKNADIAMFNYYQEFERKTIENHLPIKDGYLTDDWMDIMRISTFHVPKINGRYYQYEYGVLWNKLYRTDLIIKNHIRFIPEARKGQDALFNTVAYQYAKSIYYTCKVLYHYRYLQASVTNRFNENIVYYNEISFAEQERILRKFHLSEKYWIAYYSHVLTRFYSYFRLYYFNPKNHMKWKEKKRAINGLIKKEPYIIALKKYDKDVLSLTQNIFIFFLKKRMYFVIWLLVKSYQRSKKIKGEVLRKGTYRNEEN